jgi:hypothetical protein
MGVWLERFAGRLLHDDIHALFVLPAIADLQYEWDGGRARPWRALRGYLAIWTAIAGALRFQAIADAQALLVDDARLVALRYDALTLGGIVLVQACYYSGLAILFFDLQR